jgi:RNA polymerase sigma-70 factor (ECF subfamily)
MVTNELDRQWLESDFDRLYQEYDTPLRNLLYKMGYTRKDGNDVMQEVWLRIHRRRYRCPPTVDVHVWLEQVAKCAAIDYYHQNKSSLTMVDDIFAVADDISEDFRTRRCANPPEAPLQLVEDVERILRMLSILPVEQNVAIQLRWLSELSVREVAKKLDISENAVKTRCVRAFETLHLLGTHETI